MDNQENATIQVQKTFLADLRHTLRTPLNAIIGYSEMLLEDAEDQLVEPLTRDLQKIREAGQLLLELVNNNLIPENLDDRQNVATSGTAPVLSPLQSREKTSEMPVHTGSLLIVEDNADNRDVLTRHLERQGHKIMIAEHGKQALAMIRDHSFDIMLLDILMPEMDGFQVLEHLKQEGILPNLPVLMISALDEMQSVVRCIEMGADDFLPKPFNSVLLRARINACLEKKRLRDQEVEYHRKLAETNEQLQIANRNYMQMLGFVTHELKAPLSAIQSIISLVLDGFAGEVPEKIGRHLIRISRNCEELQDMVKNYLDLSRAERGELTAKKVEINFHQEVVQASVAQTQSLFDSRRETLTLTSPENLSILADPELLRIALTNYLSNAAKYGKEDGEATLTVAEEEECITVSVRNEGSGFTADEKTSLFTKFSRLRNENTANKRGSGLGLFLVKYILELHGGSVWAESEPGQWAKFCFRLPVSS